MIELERAEFVARTTTGEVRVLHPTSLRLSEQRIALIGANGSGKSTLARMLNGLVEPTGGAVRVSVRTPARSAEGTEPVEAAEDAEDLDGDGSVDTASDLGTARDIDAAHGLDTVRNGGAERRLVGFVFTDPAAQLVMPTALEDVALSLRRTHPRKTDRVRAARAALDRFGLGDLADRSVHTLSGGQKQLLAIAAVLATEPAILVADEPTTLLDLRNSRLISGLLLGLPQQTILATHDLELASRCDRVIVMEDGAVAHDSAAGTGSAGSTDEDAVAQAIDRYRAGA